MTTGGTVLLVGVCVLQALLATYLLPLVVVNSGLLTRFGVARPGLGTRLTYLIVVPVGFVLLWLQDLRLFRRFEAASPGVLAAIVHLTALVAAGIALHRMRWWPRTSRIVVPSTTVVVTTVVGLASAAALRAGTPAWLVVVLALMLVLAGDTVLRTFAPRWARGQVRRTLSRVLTAFDGDLYGLDPAVWRLVEVDGDGSHLQLLYHLRVPAPSPAVVLTCGLDPDRAVPSSPIRTTLPPPAGLARISHEVLDITEPGGLPAFAAYSGGRTTVLVTSAPPAPPPGFGVPQILSTVRAVGPQDLLAQAAAD
jgi:hypothetical protein